MSVGKQVAFGVLMAIGIALAIIFGVLPTLVEKKIRDTILTGTVLTPRGEGLTNAQYDDWETSTVDIDYYFWNVTNLKELMTQGVETGLSMKTSPFTAKPILRQVGPVGYQKRKTKYAISFSDDGYIVSYYDFTQWFRKTEGTSLNGEAFVPYDSIVTTLNLPYLVTMSSTAFLGNDGTETNAHMGLFALGFLQQSVGKIFYNDVPTNTKNLMPALRIMTYPLYVGYVNKILNPTSNAAISFQILSQYATPFGLNAGDTCSQDCSTATPIALTCKTIIFNNANVSRCVFPTSSYVTSPGYPDLQGLWELPANIALAHATSILTNTTHPFGFQNSANHWLNFLLESAAGVTSGAVAECAGYFGAADCGVVATWYGTVISLNNPLKAPYLAAVVTALQLLIPNNPYGIPSAAEITSWDQLGYFQFATCGLVQTLTFNKYKSIVQLGLAPLAALNGINLEPCAQKYRSLYAIQANYPRWNMTIAQAETFLGTTIASTANFLAALLPCQAQPLSQLCALKLDYFFYAAKYGVFLPQIVGTTWDETTGRANFNDYGTGLCWKPASSLQYAPGAFGPGLTCPTDKIFGGSGLFTTRTVEELLLGVNNEALLLTVNGGVFGGIFGPNTTDPAAVKATTPSSAEALGPYEVFTGKDGINEHITFYHKYLGSSQITKVADMYDGGDGTAANPGSAPRICLAAGQVRASFDAGCSIWRDAGTDDEGVTWSASEVIDGTSDGFKAPYMFQEGKDPVDMMVWVDEGQRQVRFSYTESLEIKSNIKVWKYKMHKSTLQNTTSTWEGANKKKSKHYYMVNHPNGVASRQRTDAIDLYVSKPHYLDGDVDFFKSQMDIDINPNVDLHDSYLNVEPLTGRVFAGRKRLQLGVYLSAIRHISFAFHGIYSPLVDNYLGNNATVESTCNGPVDDPDACTFPAWGHGGKNLYWPILWAAEGKDISDDDASTFSTAVYGNRQTFFITQIVLVIVGGVMFFTFLVLCIKARNESNDKTTSM